MVALCHQLRTIDKTRIGKHVGELSAADMTAIEQALRQVYALLFLLGVNTRVLASAQAADARDAGGRLN